jgi:isopropylmalate/homocitrate/citramalate synthase
MMAHSLSRLGVDDIEAGFPVSSTSEFNTVRRIAADVGNSVDGREQLGFLEPPVIF